MKSGTAASIYSMANTNVKVIDKDTKPTAIAGTTPQEYEWTLLENTETMIRPFYVKIVADGAASKN